LTGAMGWLGSRPWLVGLGLARERGRVSGRPGFFVFLVFFFSSSPLDWIGLSVFLSVLFHHY
jgi:hypothetical protein